MINIRSQDYLLTAQKNKAYINQVMEGGEDNRVFVGGDPVSACVWQSCVSATHYSQEDENHVPRVGLAALWLTLRAT